jgi:hypothetical protein
MDDFGTGDVDDDEDDGNGDVLATILIGASEKFTDFVDFDF